MKKLNFIISLLILIGWNFAVASYEPRCSPEGNLDVMFNEALIKSGIKFCLKSTKGDAVADDVTEGGFCIDCHYKMTEAKTVEILDLVTELKKTDSTESCQQIKASNIWQLIDKKGALPKETVKIIKKLLAKLNAIDKKQKDFQLTEMLKIDLSKQFEESMVISPPFFPISKKDASQLTILFENLQKYLAQLPQDQVETISKTATDVYNNELASYYDYRNFVYGESFDSYYRSVNYTPRVLSSRPNFVDCGLSNFQLYAIYDYTAAGYSTVNSHLRSDDPPNESIKKGVKVTNDGLKKIADHIGPVRRGADLPEEIRKSHAPNSKIIYKAYTSTSLGRGFLANDQFIIFSSRGKMIDWLSGHPEEQEVLFVPNTEFKILERTDRNKGEYYNRFIMKEENTD